jgi:hypothetical protein
MTVKNLFNNFSIEGFKNCNEVGRSKFIKLRDGWITVIAVLRIANSNLKL